MRPATEGEIAHWDELILANPDGGHIQQTKTWGEFKSGFGWKPQFMIHELPGATIAVLYLVRKFNWYGELWWAPKGPGVADSQQLGGVVKQIKLPGRPFMLRLDPSLKASEVVQQDLAKVGLQPAKLDAQPDKATILVDLSPEEEAIIGSFKQKTRYNIRLAAKKGVSVEAVEASQSNLDLMYRMMRETSSRGNYYMRDKGYYQTYWKRLTESGQGQLIFASFEGEVLAGLFAMYLGAKAWYKDGGSFRQHSNVMAPYLLQWETMRWLKARAVTSYDLVGVPPERDLNSEHKIYSLYQFKSGFNSEITEYCGAYDLPLSPMFKQWDSYGERVVSKYYIRTKRQLIY